MEESLRRPLSRDRINWSSSENWFRKRQSSAIADSWHGGGPKGDGLSNVQQARGAKSLQTDNSPKGYTPEHLRKPSQHRPEAFSQDRKTNRRSADTTKRGYRGTRPSTSSHERSKSGIMNSSTFEVKLSDFPELCDITSSSPKTAFIQEPRTCWGPVTSPAHQDSIADQNICQNTVGFQDTLGKKGPKQKPTEQVTSAGKYEKTLTPGQDTGLRLPNPNESPAASWANIASQPPKVIQKSSATRTAQVEKSQQQAEQSTEKKRKKKKKKSKTASEGMEPTDDVPRAIQERPLRFEDEEEFPDLSCTFVNLHKGLRHTSCTAQEYAGWSDKEALSLHPEVVNKSKTTAGKPFATDSKKTQQVSQKKSKAPVQLDLGNMLAVLEQKQQSQKSKQDVKPLTLSVGGALPVIHKEPAVPKKHPRQQERIAHNPLDSTSPLVKKGKQREVPKAKKPTPLKRVILKEREVRKQNRLLEERDPALMASEAIQIETHSSETQEETSNPMSEIITNDLDLECELSRHTDAEEIDQTTLQVINMDNTAEEKTVSESGNPDTNSSLDRPKIHSRKFREYCSQMLSKDVDECVTNLLKELVRFQDRLYQKDPMKARMKRRLVMGLREVLKHLKLRKVKCVIISPNCERVQSKGGLDEALHTIIDTCREQGVPFVFALSRKSLGRCVNKAVPVSLVGIFNFDGAQDHYHKMIELTSQARRAYEVMIANLEVTMEEQQGEEETPQKIETPSEPPATEEPEYIKVWKKMLEKDYNHKFLVLEEQFSSVAISTDSDTLPDDHDGS